MERRGEDEVGFRWWGDDREEGGKLDVLIS